MMAVKKKHVLVFCKSTPIASVKKCENSSSELSIRNCERLKNHNKADPLSCRMIVGLLL